MIAIAIAPTVAAQLFGRLAGLVTLVIAIPIAIGAATGMWPGSSGHHRYPAAVALWINHGAHDWFNATTPFDYGRFNLVDGDARLLFMALVALLAWTAVLRRWALISIGIGLVLFAFPSTVLILSHPWLRAAWFLAAALVALRLIPRKSLGGGGSSQAWALGTAVVMLGLVVSALPGVNKAAFMSWHTWDPLREHGRAQRSQLCVEPVVQAVALAAASRPQCSTSGPSARCTGRWGRSSGSTTERGRVTCSRSPRGYREMTSSRSLSRSRCCHPRHGTRRPTIWRRCG